jgi:hypothetical protein
VQVCGVRCVAFAGAVALALAGCSGDDDSDDDAASARQTIDLSSAASCSPLSVA